MFLIVFFALFPCLRFCGLFVDVFSAELTPHIIFHTVLRDHNSSLEAGRFFFFRERGSKGTQGGYHHNLGFNSIKDVKSKFAG